MDVKCVQEATTEFIFYLAGAGAGTSAATVFPIYLSFFVSVSFSHSFSFPSCPCELFRILHIWIFIMNSPRAVFTINRCQLRMNSPQKITK